MRPGPATGFLVLFLRLALAVVFAYSGIVKLADPQAFAFAVKDFKILPDHLAVLVTFTIPWTEILCAACLLFGLFTQAAATLLFLCLIVFISAILSVLARGMNVHCGCFGALKLACSGPLGICHIIQNSALLIATVPVMVFGYGRLGLDARSEGVETAPPRT